MSAKRTVQSSSSQPSLSGTPDPDFDQALDEFARALQQTLETLLRERIAAIDERITGLTAIANSREALVERATAAEARISKLQHQLAKALARANQPDGGVPTPTAEPSGAEPEPDRSVPPMPRPPAKPRIRVPMNPTLNDVIAFLVKSGFRPQNNRKVGGGVWVFANQEQFAQVLKELKSAGIGARYFPRGRKLQPGPQYEIDPSKVLPD